jgi:hypothetical protein
VDFWHMTRHANLAEYVTESDRGKNFGAPLQASADGVGSAVTDQ